MHPGYLYCTRSAENLAIDSSSPSSRMQRRACSVSLERNQVAPIPRPFKPARKPFRALFSSQTRAHSPLAPAFELKSKMNEKLLKSFEGNSFMIHKPDTWPVSKPRAVDWKKDTFGAVLLKRRGSYKSKRPTPLRQASITKPVRAVVYSGTEDEADSSDFDPVITPDTFEFDSLDPNVYSHSSPLDSPTRRIAERFSALLLESEEDTDADMEDNESVAIPFTPLTPRSVPDSDDDSDWSD